MGVTPLTMMLSIGGCTKTKTGALLPPSAEAVTWAAPVPPGVQVVKLASQCPAQATPFGAIFKTEVSLEANVKVVERLVPEVDCAEAVKVKVPPSTREAVLEGLIVILPAKMGGPAFLPPPHPLTLHKERMESVTSQPPERNLPMHPSLLCPVQKRNAQDELLNELENL